MGLGGDYVVVARDSAKPGGGEEGDELKSRSSMPRRPAGCDEGGRGRDDEIVDDARYFV